MTKPFTKREISEIMSKVWIEDILEVLYEMAVKDK